MKSALKQTIDKQRKILVDLLKQPLAELALSLSTDIHRPEQLEKRLREAFPVFKHCKYLYVMDAQGVQITSTITRYDNDINSLYRDRSKRPYMQQEFNCYGFALSEAYISKHNHRPSVTAIQKIYNELGELYAYLGVDFDLRELPGTNHLYKEDYQWQQIKGDPAIRSGLFAQQRLQSDMDNNIDNVFALMEALICEHGVFHGKFHFSSSRTTIWLLDDPYNYRLLSMQELNDPDICLAYPRHAYSSKASVPESAIHQIFNYFRELRFADEVIYLRAGSINIINGMVSLNFSCDGSHYLPYQEFLNKGLSFWFGTEQEELNTQQFDEILESLCEKGCEYIMNSIIKHRQGESVSEVQNLPYIEQDKIIQELENVMKLNCHFQYSE
jgi:hypothetical protein